MGKKSLEFSSSSSSDEASSSSLSSDSSVSSSDSNSSSDSERDRKPNQFLVTHDGLLTPIVINSDEELPWTNFRSNAESFLQLNLSRGSLKSDKTPDLTSVNQTLDLANQTPDLANQTLEMAQKNPDSEHVRDIKKMSLDVNNAIQPLEKLEAQSKRMVATERLENDFMRQKKNTVPNATQTSIKLASAANEKGRQAPPEFIRTHESLHRNSKASQPVDTTEEAKSVFVESHKPYEDSQLQCSNTAMLPKLDSNIRRNHIVSQVSVIPDEAKATNSVQTHLIVNTDQEKCYQVSVQNDDPLQQTIVINSINTVQTLSENCTTENSLSGKPSSDTPTLPSNDITSEISLKEDNESEAAKNNFEMQKKTADANVTPRALRRSNRINKVNSQPNPVEKVSRRLVTSPKTSKSKSKSGSKHHYSENGIPNNSVHVSSKTDINQTEANTTDKSKIAKTYNQPLTAMNNSIIHRNKIKEPKDEKCEPNEKLPADVDRQDDKGNEENLEKEHEDVESSDDESWEDIKDDPSTSEPSADFIARTKAMLERRKSQPENDEEVLLPVTSTPVKLKPVHLSNTDKPKISEDLSSCFSQMSIDWEKARQIFDHNKTMSPLKLSNSTKTTPCKLNLKNNLDDSPHVPSPVDPEVAKIFEQSLLVSPCKQIPRPKKPSRRVSLIKISDDAAADFGKSPSPTTAWEMGQKLFSGKYDWKNTPTTPTKTNSRKQKVARKPLFTSVDPKMANWAKGLNSIKGDYPFSSSKLHVSEVNTTLTVKESSNKDISCADKVASTNVHSSNNPLPNESSGTTTSQSQSDSVGSGSYQKSKSDDTSRKSDTSENDVRKTVSSSDLSSVSPPSSSTTYVRQYTPKKSSSDDSHLFKTPTKSLRRNMRKAISVEKGAEDGSDKSFSTWSPGNKYSDQSCPYDPSETGCYSTTVEQASSESDLQLAPSIDAILREKERKTADSVDNLSRSFDIQFEESPGFEVTELEDSVSPAKQDMEQSVTVDTVLPKLLHRTETADNSPKKQSEEKLPTKEHIITSNVNKNNLISEDSMNEEVEKTSIKHVKSLFDVGDVDLDYEDTCQSPKPIKVGYGNEFVDEGEILSDEGQQSSSGVSRTKSPSVHMEPQIDSVPVSSHQSIQELNHPKKNIGGAAILHEAESLGSEIVNDLDILKRSKERYEQELRQLEQVKKPDLPPIGTHHSDISAKDFSTSTSLGCDGPIKEISAILLEEVREIEDNEAKSMEAESVEAPQDVQPADTDSGSTTFSKTNISSASNSAMDSTPCGSDNTPNEVNPDSVLKKFTISNNRVDLSSNPSNPAKTNIFLRSMLQADESLGCSNSSKNFTPLLGDTKTDTHQSPRDNECLPLPNIESIAVNIALSSQEELGALTPKRDDYHLQDTKTPLSCRATQPSTNTEEARIATKMMLLSEENADDWTPQNSMDVDTQNTGPSKSQFTGECAIRNETKPVNDNTDAECDPRSVQESVSQSDTSSINILKKPDTVKRKLSLYEYVTIKESSQKHKSNSTKSSSGKSHVNIRNAARPPLTPKIKYHFLIPISVPPKPFLYPKRVQQIQTKLINELVDGIDFSIHPPITTPSYMKLRKATPLEENEDPLGVAKPTLAPIRKEVIGAKNNDDVGDDKSNNAAEFTDDVPMKDNNIPLLKSSIFPVEDSNAIIVENNDAVSVENLRKEADNTAPLTSTAEIDDNSKSKEPCKMSDVAAMRQIMTNVLARNNAIYNAVPNFLDEESHEYFKHVKIPKVKRVTDSFVTSTSFLDCSDDADTVQQIVQSSFAADNPEQELSSLVMNRDPSCRASKTRDNAQVEQPDTFSDTLMNDSPPKQETKPETSIRLGACNEDSEVIKQNSIKVVNSYPETDDKGTHGTSFQVQSEKAKTNRGSIGISDQPNLSFTTQPSCLSPPKSQLKLCEDEKTNTVKCNLIPNLSAREDKHCLVPLSQEGVADSSKTKQLPEINIPTLGANDLNVSRHHPVISGKLSKSFKIPKKKKASVPDSYAEALTGRDSIKSFLSSDSRTGVGQTLFTQRKKKQLDEIILKEREEKQKRLKELLKAEREEEERVGKCINSDDIPDKEDSSKGKRKKTSSPEKVQTFDLRNLLTKTAGSIDNQAIKRLKTQSIHSSTNDDCQLDFFSELFDPLVVLNFKSSRLKIPDPKARAFDSLSEWLVSWREAEVQLKELRTLRLKIRNPEYEPRDTSKIKLSNINLSQSELITESEKLKAKQNTKDKTIVHDDINPKSNDPTSYGWKKTVTETVFEPFFDTENHALEIKVSQKSANASVNPLLRKTSQPTSICMKEKINLPKLWSDCIARANVAHRDYKRKRKPTVLDTMAGIYIS